MQIAKQALIMFMILVASKSVFAVWEMSIENLIGAADATVTVCKDIDPAGVKRGLALMEKTLSSQEKANLPKIRNSDKYKSAYADEVTRLMSLSTQERGKACEHAW